MAVCSYTDCSTDTPWLGRSSLQGFLKHLMCVECEKLIWNFLCEKIVMTEVLQTPATLKNIVYLLGDFFPVDWQDD